MNGQQNMNLDWNNLVAAPAPQLQGLLNENDLQMLAMAVVEQHQQQQHQQQEQQHQYPQHQQEQQQEQQDHPLAPEPVVVGYRIIYNMDDFVASAIETLQSIITVYGHEHSNRYYSRAGWYANLDEFFDQMSRMVLGHRNMWQDNQYMRDILRPVFMARHRMGRHIELEEAQQLLEAFIRFRDQ